MPLLLYLSVCAWDISIFCIVLCVLKATLICVSLKSLVIFLTPLPLYVKVTHFVSWCWGLLCAFCLCGERSFQLNLLYSLLCNMFLMAFISVSFAF
jgi:hypothetical protein